MFSKTITHRFLKTLENIEYGRLDVETPEGALHFFVGSKPGPMARLKLHSWSVVTNLAAKGDIGFAEDYRDGLWETDNLPGLLLLGLKNKTAFSNYIHGGMLARIAAQISYLFKRNTLNGSRRNIHAHYDLGNDFYRLWLDPSMTYSAAIFNAENEPLAQAQYNKYDRIIGQLNGNSGSILEVGCGWGGFAERAMEKGDFTLKGVTLSEEQHSYATKRLKNKADIVLEDYRHQEGTYDFIVSIEMFEAVGKRFWQTYFQKIKSLMSRSGKAVIQTITIDDTLFENYRRGGDMIRSFIFPGGMLPSPERFRKAAAKADLKVTDSYIFGTDYATTLEHWLAAFEQKKQQVKSLGFDEPFVRLWRFYLSACIASFRVEQTSVMQVELQHV